MKHPGFSPRVLVSRLSLAPLCLAAAVLAGCASSGTSVPVEHRKVEGGKGAVADPDVYVVKKGDTLYAIALDHGLDYKDLVAWNGIDNPNRILVGQQLRLNGRGKTVAASTESSGVVVQPIGGIGNGGTVERRSLEGTPAPAQASAASTANAASGGYKREPKAGKEPYSEAAQARLAGASATTPPAVTPAAPTVARSESKTESKPEPKVEAKAETKPESKPDSSEAKAVSTDDLAWGWPAPGKVSAGFSSANKGLDITGKNGDPVLAAADGKVAYVGSGIAALGKLVILRHNTNYLSAYAHNSAILVKEGQSVSRGQKIAEFGSSGTDSVKLHFQIRRQGTPVDPAQYLPKR